MTVVSGFESERFDKGAPNLREYIWFGCSPPPVSLNLVGVSDTLKMLRINMI